MVAARVERFGGMVPILSKRLLPDTAATNAVNVDLESGEIRPIQLPSSVQTFTTMKRAFRIPDPAAPATPLWLAGVSQFSRFFPTPITNDSFQRFIWIDGNAPEVAVQPVVNSFARIKAGNTGANAPIQLGVPRPSAAPGLVVTGGSSTTITRSYVYTQVNLFGEEGQPSDPVTVTGHINGSWDVSGLTQTAGRGVTAVRIYRTITGAGGTTLYYRVTETTGTTYSDTISDSTLLLAPIVLQSALWAEPPALEGMVLMPSGFFAGWKGRDIYFSEPYRPWAWNPSYVLTVPNKVVGCGVHGGSLLVLTEGRPTAITGQRPDTLSLATWDSPEPCASPNSVCSSPEGVYFVGRTGLMVATPFGVTNITRNLITQSAWRDSYVPANLAIVRLNASQLLAYSTNGSGFILDLSNERTALQTLANFAAVDSAWTDLYTGVVYLASLNTVWEWQKTGAPYSVGRWESKEWHFQKPVNMGALKVFLDVAVDPNAPTIPSIVTQPGIAVAGGPWTNLTSVVNYMRLNESYVGESPATGSLPPGGGAGASGWPLWYGVEPSNLTTIADLNLPAGVAARVEVYGDGVLRWVGNVQNNVMYRPASGFKAAIWKIVILSRVPVFSVHIAETGKELAKV